MKTFLTFVVALSSLVAYSIGWTEENALHIQTPWVRAAPPTVKVLAAYMIIENTSDQEKILTAVTSPAFETVEIHQTVHHEGVMHMQPQKQLEIAPHGKVVLEPGGYHLMLINGKQILKVGDTVQLNLKFSTGEAITITPSVQDASHSGHMK